MRRIDDSSHHSQATDCRISQVKRLMLRNAPNNEVAWTVKSRTEAKHGTGHGIIKEPIPPVSLHRKISFDLVGGEAEVHSIMPSNLEYFMRWTCMYRSKMHLPNDHRNNLRVSMPSNSPCSICQS